MSDGTIPGVVDLSGRDCAIAEQVAPGTGNTMNVNLPAEERKLGNVLEEATAASMKWDIGFRALMLVVVCTIFVGLNWSVMAFVNHALAQDLAQMAAMPPMAAADRLITSNVVMSLIGATVVQTGIGFIAITSYLFPKRAGA